MKALTSQKASWRFVELVCTLVIALCSITGFIKAQTPPTTAPSVNGKIAFARFANSDPHKGQIWEINPDGSGLMQLTNTPKGTGCDSPAWSPNGTRIAFSSWGAIGYYSFPQWEIYVMDGDGSNQTELTKNSDYRIWDRWPAWSPDGGRIAFTRVNTGFGGGPPVDPIDAWNQIYVMAADGSRQVRLTSTTAAGNFLPAWSPDGTRIAFTRNSNGGSEIYVMNADGSNQRQLTNSPGNNEAPAWSPDGTKIAFDIWNTSTGASDIYVMNADGSNQTRLTNYSSPSIYGPEWSPDGTKIVFGGSPSVLLMSADGSNPVWFTAGGSPSWQRLPGPR